MGTTCKANDELATILNKNFTSEFRNGYINVSGTVMPESFTELYNKIENWKVFNDDVWVCSFPKSGTTWTQEMCWMIMNDFDYEGAEAELGKRFPFLEISAIFDYKRILRENTNFVPPVYLNDSVKYTAQQKSPRFIKTHLPWALLPQQIRNFTKRPKIIYVARNPKDTCVSYYHHCRLIEGYSGSFEDYCNLFLAGKLCFAPYWKNLLGYWKRRHEPNILFLKFEDMKRDLPETIKKVAEFLGKTLTNDQFEFLLNHLSFESMKKNKSVNYEPFIDLHKKYNLIKGEGCFMRSGTVGNYNAVMSQDFIEKFDTWTRENTSGTGLTFSSGLTPC